MADNRPVPMPPHIKAELDRLRALMVPDAEAYRRREIGSKRMEEEAKKIQPLRPLSAADTDLEYLSAASGGQVDMDRMRLELMKRKKVQHKWHGGPIVDTLVNTFPSLAPVANAIGATKVGLSEKELPTDNMYWYPNDPNNLIGNDSRGDVNPMLGIPKSTQPTDLPKSIKMYRADPTGKYGGKEGIETLPQPRFDVGGDRYHNRVEDPAVSDVYGDSSKAIQQLYRYARLNGAANKYGYPSLSPEDVAAMALKEGRSDLGFNAVNLGHPDELKFNKMLRDTYNLTSNDQNFLAALFAKQRVADKFKIPFAHAWNGTGVNDAGQSGKDYAKNYEYHKKAALHPNNQQLMDLINRAIEDGKKHGLPLRENSIQDSSRKFIEVPYKAKGGQVKKHNFVKHKRGEKVGGYDVGEKINNYGSYASSGIDDVEEGIHRVPMSAFEVTHPNKLFYAKNDIEHVHRLAEQIKHNKYMDPLLVAMDKKGAYVLEGGHRLGAAHLLGMKEIPAMIGHEPEDYAEGGAVNPFDYENPEHVSTVAGHVSKHKDFSKLPDASKHLGEVLSTGSYKHMEDPRVQMGLRKAGYNSYYTQEKTGKKLNKMVINKAMGGAVPSVNAMRAELAKKMPTSLSDLSSIGANEAPSMNIKAYVPPAQGGDLPVGGIDMNDVIKGVQFMPEEAQAMQAPQQPQGAPQGQPQGQPSPLSAGASRPQPPSNILQMTPQGQALNAMTPPQAPARMAVGGSVPAPYKIGGSDNMPPPDNGWKPDNGVSTFNIDNVQQAAKGGKVEVRSTVFDDAASRRNPKIEAAARALMEGEMTKKAYAKLVAKEKPVAPYEFIPRPATDEEALSALHEPKRPKWRAHESWPAGHRVGLRLDIPAYEGHGVWVNSIHDESGAKGADMLKTAYGPVSAVRNAEFQGTPHKAIQVATGEQNKAPFAKIMGELEHMTEEEAVKHMQKYFKHPDYRQIGYDPRRHGDFYDRETMEPVTHAEHVVQIGPLVLAKKPKYGKREIFAKGGSAKPKKPLHYAPAPAMKKAEIEAHAERMARQTAGLENPTGKTLQQLAREKDLKIGIKSSKKNEQPIIDYQNLKGSYSVGVPGDTSRGGLKPYKGTGEPKAGEYLTSIGGESLEHPVGLFGGKDYGAYGHPAGWASDLGASRGMFNVVRRLAKENPESKIFGHYHKMSPEALFHAVHMLDTVLAHHQPHKLPQEQIEMLNNLMRNERLTTNKNDKPYPEFAGFENPADIRLQAPFNSGMRKKIISMLGKEKYVSGGKQKLDDIIYAISHPELRNIETGAGGSSIIQFDPNRSLKESISPHPTYGHDIPSELVGRTRYATPADILAPRSMHNARQQIAAMGKKVIPFNQAKMNIIREPIDEQYINQMGEYENAMRKRLGYKKGGKVKLSTNMDTINLELSRRSKKAK